MKRDFIFFSLYKSDDMQQWAGSAERSVSGSGVLLSSRTEPTGVAPRLFLTPIIKEIKSLNCTETTFTDNLEQKNN